MNPYTELPERPEPDGNAAIVLDVADPLFAEAVRTWGAEWESRVACWRATGSPYAVVTVTPNAAYFRLYAAQDEATLSEAIELAIKTLSGAPCRWRAGSELRSLVWSHVRRDYDRRRREARQAARSLRAC